MPRRIARSLRTHTVAYLALFLAIGGGSGYALAAANSNTIHGCVNKHTHALYIQSRCHRGQTKIVWKQQGPQGKQGATGPAASAAFGVVDTDGVLFAGQSQGVSVQHSATGIYEMTITAQGCSTGGNAPTVTPTQTIAGHLVDGSVVPVAWIDANGIDDQFTVHTGFMSGGAFTVADVRFDVQDACRPAGRPGRTDDASAGDASRCADLGNRCEPARYCFSQRGRHVPG